MFISFGSPPNIDLSSLADSTRALALSVMADVRTRQHTRSGRSAR
jgi:hypothetical protein